jgi:mono/diheme cytochrome c family protein
MRRRAVVLARILSCICASWLALACQRDQTPLGRGGRIFQRTCAQCHGADGRGLQRLGLSKPPRDLTRPEFHEQATDGQLREVIRYGKGQMPAFGGLMADEDIGHVITFIRTLAPQSKVPKVTEVAPKVSEAPKGDASSASAGQNMVEPPLPAREARTR